LGDVEAEEAMTLLNEKMSGIRGIIKGNWEGGSD
jgi:hypothetical protein